MRIEEKEYTKSIDISIWKKVFPFLAPRKNVLIMVIVMNILCSVVDIIMPLFQRQAIDSFIEKNTLAGLGGFIALYIAVIVFQMWSVICFTRGCMTLDVETGRDMKRALFVHLQKLSFSYYNATPVGYILSRVMNDVARIDHGVHEKIFSLWHVTYFIPGENLVHWQAVTILHNLLAGSTLFLVYKVTDEKVNCFGAFYQLFQSFQDFFVGFFIYPVIAVYNLEIEPLGIVDTGVYGAAVAKVWLMDGADNAWIFLLVFICDLGCSVLGSIVRTDLSHM